MTINRAKEIVRTIINGTVSNSDLNNLKEANLYNKKIANYLKKWKFREKKEYENRKFRGI